jgi:hypothetical protein
MSLNPEQARIAIAEAERRTNQRQVRQMRLLILALIALTFIAGFSAAGFFIAYSQARRNGKTADRVLALTQKVASLQDQVVTETAIAQIVSNRILDCTTPDGKCAHDVQVQTGAAINAINQANALGRQDLLRKLGQLAHALGAPQSVVDQVLNEPVPTPPAFPVPPPPPNH